MSKIDFYYVLSGTKIGGEKVYYAIDQHSGGWPYWSSYIGHAKQFQDLTNINSISNTDYLRKEVTEISVLEISVVSKVVATEEIVSHVKAKAMAEIAEIQKQLDAKVAALKMMT